MINAIDVWNRFARERRGAASAEGDYWLSKAKDYSRLIDRRWAEGDDETREFLKRLFADRSLRSVLDIGAGTGRRCFSPGWALTRPRLNRPRGCALS